MDSQEELKTIVKSQNLLAEDIAVAIENDMGFEIGSIENLNEVIRQLSERVSQTLSAISLLDEEKHIIPLNALINLNENYHIPGLQNALERLRQVKWD
jgi:hypothetical protein